MKLLSEDRLNPDRLLKVIDREESEKNRGRLKIFFGYAAGVGKTYAMLEAAHQAKDRGVDVVIGYVESHARPQTQALAEGLEKVPLLKLPHANIELNEFNLDAAIARKPQLILVDELAHTNAEGCRHSKRYQDVQELLKAGVDVYTTVNVQHIESLNDMVASITGVAVRERIPDSVFDDADQVELIDIEPHDLVERLQAGKIYKPQQAERAIDNFFTVENLTALREIALRRCADRVNLITQNDRIKNNREYCTDDHILVCLSSSPSNAKIIRTASRMAGAFNSTFTALYVQTPDYEAMSEENKKRLRANIRLAQQLGAKIETAYGDDVAQQIADFARHSGVSKVVIGRSAVSRRFFWNKPTYTERLIALAPNLDVYIIPDYSSAMAKYRAERKKSKSFAFSASDTIKSILVLVIASLIGALFDKSGFTEVNIITVYILGVVITSVLSKNLIYSLISSIVSVFVFNFLFTEPRYTFKAYDSQYPVTFVVMFIVAFITGQLTARLKNNARQSARVAFRTKVLFDTNQLLQKAKDVKEIADVTANQLIKLLDRDIVIYPCKEGGLGEPYVYTVSGEAAPEQLLSENEKAVAGWVFKNNKHAGATTDTLADAKALYLSIRVNENVYGVVGIVIGDNPLDTFENSILLAILGESALALENVKNAKEKQEAAVITKNEQLRANLLRAISHDLRTPLTSISGNANNLLANGDAFDEEAKRRIYSDIYDDSMWLINLVENLLSVTRLEDGQMNLHISAELVDDVIREALLHISRESAYHNISVEIKDDLLLAKMDSRLIVQVIINIVDNAVKYTPKGSDIKIMTEQQGDEAVVKIADNGPGISDEAKSHVFDMFYSGANKVADSRRSLGLGLSLCKSIITAHGGKIWVEDNIPHGTIFIFTLPVQEAHLHE